MFRRHTELRAGPVHAPALAQKFIAVDIDLSDFAPAPVAPDPGWLESSRDLQHGLRVRETPMDALPAELIGAFFEHRR